MGFFKKFASKRDIKEDGTTEEQQQTGQEQEGVQPPRDLFSSENTIICNVRDTWEWVIEDLSREKENLSLVEKPTDLPTAILAAANGNEEQPAVAARRSGRRKKTPGACTLRLEIKNAAGEIIEAVHGTSEAFDGLEDKDELVRTIQRCRCENLEISPPSRLINWDVTKEECMNLVGESLPSLSSNENKEGIAVLKEPMGSSGTGVFFVTNAQQIHEIIEEHRRRAVEEPNFLDNLIAAKGRIPSWVLQAEVIPCLLIRGRRKFHIRTYVACMERLHLADIVQTYVYNKHEIRIAGESVPEGETHSRDRTAHITNGNHSSRTERDLLDNEPELVNRKLQERVELFVAQIFDQHFIQDITRRVSISASEDAPARKFVVGGLDIMVTDDNRLYLLEVNVNPAAPARETVSEQFQQHMTAVMDGLMALAVGKYSPNFVPCKRILARKTQFDA